MSVSICARRFFFLFLLFFFSFVQSAQAAPIKVVASFTILADMIRQVGGDKVEVVSLVGPDEDAHSFQPSPEAVRQLAEADIIAINGLHFEGWLTRLIDASGSKAPLLVSSAGVRPRLLDAPTPSHHDGIEETLAPDPHAWQNLRNGLIYVRNIAGALSAAQPENRNFFLTRAKAYSQKLRALDRTLLTDFAAIPPARRKILTSHDAFGYFGEAYGVTFLSPLGLNTDVDPSAEDIKSLIEQIKMENIAVYFIENMAAPHLIRQIAQETGAKPGGMLYADALTAPNGEAPTYLDLFEQNARKMIAALKN